jgi:tRNA A37 threonylcarbamoyladenosine dehydratase
VKRFSPRDEKYAADIFTGERLIARAVMRKKLKKRGVKSVKAVYSKKKPAAPCFPKGCYARRAAHRLQRPPQSFRGRQRYRLKSPSIAKA